MTTMTSRKALFHVIDEMCNELRKKLVTDFDNIFIDKWTVGWQVIPPPSENEDEEKHLKSPSRKRSVVDDDMEDNASFNYKAAAGFKVGTERLRIETSYEKYKYIEILSVGSIVEGKLTQLRTNISWYDRLRPTFWKMNRLIKYSRKLRIQHQALNIEKDLAKIIPDRIDNILLGGTSAKT